MEVGTKLREIRDEAGLSQAELARRASTSQSAVARYETGATVPSLPTLERLFAVCGRRLEVVAGVGTSAAAASAPMGGLIGDRAAGLRANRRELLAAAERHGLSSVRVFGSVARGEDGATSDVDLLVDLPSERTLLDLIAFRDEAQEILGTPVDVAASDMLKAGIRPVVEAEALRL